MLRTLKHAFNSPRLLALKATSAASAVTVNISPDEIVSAVSASAGKAVLTVGDVFQRPGVCVGTPFDNVGASGALLINADPTYAVLDFLTHDGTSADDGSFNALVLGYDSDESDYTPFGDQNAPFHVKNNWNSARIEVFKITPDATTPVINIGSAKATLTRNGAGDYTVTFLRPFSSDNVIAVATPIKGTIAHAHIVSCSATAVRLVVGSGGSGNDAAPFYLIVQGSDNPSIGARERKVTKVTDRLPRLVAGHIAYSGGTPSIVDGTGDFTVADTNTGIVTITLVNPFEREPVVVANQDAVGNVTVGAAATSSTIILECFNAAGTNTDPADLHFFCIGSDDPTEYAI